MNSNKGVTKGEILISRSKAFQRVDPSLRSDLEAQGYRVTEKLTDEPINKRDLVKLIKGKVACIVSLEKVTSDVIKAADRLKVIAKYGVGVDNIDVEAATRKGIVVVNTPGANANAVAELTIGLMLSIARRIPQSHNLTQKGGWETTIGQELCGKTFGIIGLGNIGKEVVRRVKGFKMNVLAYDKVEDAKFANRNRVLYCSLPEVLQRADFVSIHVSLNSSTRGLIGYKELELMKREAFLINTSRGEVVNENALQQALLEGTIAGAAIDTYSQEPPSSDCPLLALDNIVTTSHIGASTNQATVNVGNITKANVTAVLEGREPPNVVNPKVLTLDSGPCQ